MIVFKRCKCGNGRFYQEDDGTWRCDECERLAEFEWVKDCNEEHCVSCGAVIPEGRQICPQCEKECE